MKLSLRIENACQEETQRIQEIIYKSKLALADCITNDDEEWALKWEQDIACLQEEIANRYQEKIEKVTLDI